MKISNYYIPTLKEAPKEVTLPSVGMTLFWHPTTNLLLDVLMRQLPSL